jgi:hypothetical protein
MAFVLDFLLEYVTHSHRALVILNISNKKETELRPKQGFLQQPNVPL